VAAISRLKFAHLAFFSKPAGDRWVWRHIRRRRPTRIVQFGVGDARRAGLLIRVAQRYSADRDVSYTGIDPFEAELTAGCLPLKEAHRRLSATGGKVRLVPGSPASALPGVANALSRTDLLIISAEVAEADLDSAWFYVPRMLTDTSLVIQQHLTAEGDSSWRRIDGQQIDALTKLAQPRRAA
jgi:hypothetical protein